MRFDGVELHNVAETREHGGVEGHLLQRVPEEIRDELNELGQLMMRYPAGAEIRFIADGPVRLTLSCPEDETEHYWDAVATPFWGPFQATPDEQVTVGPEPTTIEMTFPEELQNIDSKHINDQYFDPRVGRLVLRGPPMVLHDIVGDVRPPREGEIPHLCYLAYGTSITQGAFASNHSLTYVSRTARRLGTDLLNLGSAGSAFCEPEIADFIATRDDWDIATLALSVNMLGAGFTVSEFRERASYMIDTICSTDRPVAAITLFPVDPDFRPDSERAELWDATPEEYRVALRDVVDKSTHDNIHLIDGPDLLEDITGLCPDLVHPTDQGMIDIGEKLAVRLRELFDL